MKKAKRSLALTTALIQLKDASQRAHLHGVHSGAWEDCDSRACIRDRQYLISQGIDGKRLK